MTDKAMAIAAAQTHAAAKGLQIAEDRVTERARGWVIPARASGPAHVPAQGPYFVDKQTGAVFDVPTARTQAWLETYDATGKPPPLPTKWHWLGSGRPPEIKRPPAGQRRTRTPKQQ
jgi:hypothetical protein